MSAWSEFAETGSHFIILYMMQLELFCLQYYQRRNFASSCGFLQPEPYFTVVSQRQASGPEYFIETPTTDGATMI